MGCPRPWEKRGLRLGLGMLVLTHQAGFYSRGPGAGPNVPQLGGVFLVYTVQAPLWSGLGMGISGPGRGELPVLVVNPSGVGVRVWYFNPRFHNSTHCEEGEVGSPGVGPDEGSFIPLSVGGGPGWGQIFPGEGIRFFCGLRPHPQWGRGVGMG